MNNIESGKFSRQLSSNEEFLHIETVNMFTTWRFGSEDRCYLVDSKSQTSNDNIENDDTIHYTTDNDDLLHYPVLTEFVLWLHRILMKNCINGNSGEVLRNTNVETDWKDECHVYPFCYEVSQFYQYQLFVHLVVYAVPNWMSNLTSSLRSPSLGSPALNSIWKMWIHFLNWFSYPPSPAIHESNKL